MLFSQQELNEIESKRLYLATPDEEILGVLQPTECRCKVNLIDYSELNFTINKKDNPLFDDLKIYNKIFVEDIGWFQLQEPSFSDNGETQEKQCTAYSIEYEFNQKNIENLTVNTGEKYSEEWLVYQEDHPDFNYDTDHVPFDYNTQGVLLYNEQDNRLSLIHIIMEKFPDWSIGFIHPELKSLIRCLDSYSGTAYSYLMETVSNAYKCIFVFDVIRHTINAYPANELGETFQKNVLGYQTDIFLTHRSLVENLTVNLNSEDDVVTCISVNGGEDVDIMDVNIGSNKLYHFDYYYSSMPEKIRMKVQKWNSDRDGARASYKELALQHNKNSLQQMNLLNSLPETEYEITVDTDWTLFGINELQNYEKVYQQRKENLETVQGDTKSDFYIEACTILPKIQKELSNKKLQLAKRKEEEKQLIAQKNTLHGMYSFDTYFSLEEKTVLSSYIKEAAYEDTTFVIAASFSLEQIMDVQQDLLNSADFVLSKLSQPQYTVSSDIANLFKLKEFECIRNKFSLGNFITIQRDDWYSYDLRLISMEFSFFDPTDFKVTFANTYKDRNGWNDLDYLFKSLATGSAKTVSSSGRGSYASSTTSGGDNNTETNGYTLSYSEYAALKDMIDGSYKNIDADYIYTKILEADEATVEKIEAHIINTDYISSKIITADNADLKQIISDNIQAANISVDKITGTEGDFDNFFVNNLNVHTVFGDNADFNSIIAKVIDTSALHADVANIQSLLAGNAGVGDLQAFHITGDNVVFDDAVIKDLIAAKISVSDLQAGSIVLNDTMQILSENGKMIMNGSALQMLGTDADGQEFVGIQLGYDTTNNPSLILRNENGALLLSPQGITENAIADGLIKNDMIADKTLTKEKLGFEIIEPNEYGGIDITKIYDGNGGAFGVEYTTFKETTSSALSDLSANVSALSGLEAKVDKNTQSITNKIWQSDITEKINNYDSTTAKAIRDQVSEHTQTLTNMSTTISDMETKMENKADGTTVATLTERIAKAEQDSSSFKQTVSETYATKSDLHYSGCFVIGTQTSATGSWTGTASDIDALSDGQQITYWLPFAGNGNATLNLTLKNGSVTGAIPCYYSSTTRLTTHYPAGSSIRMTYRKNVSINGTTIAQGWWADANYNSDTYDRVRYQSAIKAKSAISTGNLIAADSSGYFPIAANIAFDTKMAILWAGSAITAGGTGTNNYSMYSYVNITSTKSGWTGTQYASVYLVGTLSGTFFTPNSTVFTTSVPTSDNGLTYILLGQLYSTTNMILFAEHPMYQYISGSFRRIEQGALTIAEQTSNKFSWIVKSGTSSTDFTITDRLASLTADYINLNGKVTFNGLDSDTRSQITTANSTANTALSTANAVTSTVNNNKANWDKGLTAYNWTNSNGTNMTNLLAMVKKWTNDAISTSTYIQGGWIATNTITADKIAANAIIAGKIAAGAITADKLATDAIKSRNYVANSTGSYLNLTDGSFDSKYLKWASDGSLTASNVNITGGNINIGISDSTKDIINIEGSANGIVHSVKISPEKFVIEKNYILGAAAGTYDTGCITINAGSSPSITGTIRHFTVTAGKPPSQTFEDIFYINQSGIQALGCLNMESINIHDNPIASATSGVFQVVKNGDTYVRKNLHVTGAANISGTLTLTKTTDLSGTANNSPALIIGGTSTQAHMEIDSNEIQAKSNATTTSTLTLNNDGGTVYTGGSFQVKSGNCVAPRFYSKNYTLSSSLASKATISVDPTSSNLFGANLFCGILMVYGDTINSTYPTRTKTLLYAGIVTRGFNHGSATVTWTDLETSSSFKVSSATNVLRVFQNTTSSDIQNLTARITAFYV